MIVQLARNLKLGKHQTLLSGAIKIEQSQGSTVHQTLL